MCFIIITTEITNLLEHKFCRLGFEVLTKFEKFSLKVLFLFRNCLSFSKTMTLIAARLLNYDIINCLTSLLQCLFRVINITTRKLQIHWHSTCKSKTRYEEIAWTVFIY
jgi:hypothetical protein